MIIDSHFHLEPEIMPVSKILDSMDAHGIEKTALIAGMCHNLSEPKEPVLMFMRAMLKNRTTRNMVRLLTTRFTEDGNLKLPGGLVIIESDPDNRKVFDTVDLYQDRFMAWSFVNPKGKNDAVSEFLKWADHPGCVGVKTHPFWHRYRPSDLIPVAKTASEKGKPMLMHAGFGKNGDILPLIKAVPGLKLILAHAGFPSYRDTWRLIKPFPGIFVDLSATAYVDEGTISEAVDYLGADRCVFGTDGPYGSPSESKNGDFCYGVIKTRIMRLFRDETVQKKIFRENFLALTGR